MLCLNYKTSFNFEVLAITNVLNSRYLGIRYKMMLTKTKGAELGHPVPTILCGTKRLALNTY